MLPLREEPFRQRKELPRPLIKQQKNFERLTIND